MDEESNGELAFLDPLLTKNNRKILYRLINTYTTALTTKQVAREVFFPRCLKVHIPLSQTKIT